MRRKATRQSRGPNATEKAHIQWIKERGICVACDSPGPVIAHHAEGSTCKTRVGLERVHIGHAFILGLCPYCDALVTHGSRRAIREAYGPQSELWLKQYQESPIEFPGIVVEAIRQWGK